jgi:hypothetical protein
MRQPLRPPARARPLWALLPAAALLASCGTQGEAETPAGAVPFPVTITRVGGLAGFSDRYVVEQTGSVHRDSATGPQVCRMGEEPLSRLAGIAQPITGTATTSAAHPDDLVVVVTTSRGSARLSDAELSGTASVVTTLLEDGAKHPAQRSVCR